MLSFIQKTCCRCLLLGMYLIFILPVQAQYVPEENTQEKKETQKQQSTPPAKRWQTGGNFGLMIGSTTYIDISPILGYKINHYLIPGIGVTYIYYADNYYNFSTNIYGGRIFLRALPWQRIILHTEYEMLSFKYPSYLHPDGRINVPRLLLGGGIASMLGEHSMITLLLLYNVLDGISYRQKYPIYMPNPDIRIGFAIGF